MIAVTEGVMQLVCAFIYSNLSEFNFYKKQYFSF